VNSFAREVAEEEKQASRDNSLIVKEMMEEVDNKDDHEVGEIELFTLK